MEILSLVIGIISLIGLAPLCYKAAMYFRSTKLISNFFSFDVNSQLSLILTTSTVSYASKGAKVKRPTTGYGQVSGTSSVGKFIGHYYPQKTIDIQLSMKVAAGQKSDLVILGGPAKNKYAQEFLTLINKTYPKLGLLFDDENCVLKVDQIGLDLDHKDKLQGIGNSNNSRVDIGVGIFCSNLFTDEPRRAFMCAGMSSYGTAGVSTWMFETLPSSLNRNKKDFLGETSAKAPIFISILEILVIHNTISSVTETHRINLNS